MKTNIWIHDTARIIGRVKLGDFSSVLPYAVLRGDLSSIDIGRYTNIQDHCIAHSDMGHYVKIGNFITVGHAAILHGCAVEDCCIIGMNAVLMNGAKIGRGSIVAVGTIVKENMIVPPGSLVVGNPAVIKENRYTGCAQMIENALIYYFLTRFYLKGGLPSEQDVSLIYRTAKQRAGELDARIRQGENIDTIAEEEIVL
jgi:carbonic anhydrase/acetyltransferase-like protein (isoleucine patch superfamily)